MGSKTKVSSKANKLMRWLNKQPKTVKTGLAVTLVLLTLVALKLTVKKEGYFFVASEICYFAGIVALGYKLQINKTCSGLSLKSQKLTATFVAARLICSIIFETNFHTLLDSATLALTGWVIYMMQVKLKSTYIADQDNFPMKYLIVGAAILSLFIHPIIRGIPLVGILWAFSAYVEAVSVLPQLRLMQNAKVVEPFTAHYVFGLGLSRFIACAHWIIQVYETRGKFIFVPGSNFLWFPAALVAEIVQTFILADFCYYYIKSYVDGQRMMRMPV